MKIGSYVKFNLRKTIRDLNNEQWNFFMNCRFAKITKVINNYEVELNDSIEFPKYLLIEIGPIELAKIRLEDEL